METVRTWGPEDEPDEPEVRLLHGPDDEPEDEGMDLAPTFDRRLSDEFDSALD